MPRGVYDRSKAVFPSKLLTPEEKAYNIKRSRLTGSWRTGRRGTCVPLKLPEGYTDYHDFHDRCYIPTLACQGCGISFLIAKKEMEHDGRKTGEFRGIVCSACNQKRKYTLDGDFKYPPEHETERLKSREHKDKYNAWCRKTRLIPEVRERRLENQRRHRAKKKAEAAAIQQQHSLASS